MIHQIPIIKEHIQSLIEICEKHQVSKLYVFGSIITDDFDLDTSDIDMIVELENMPPLDKGEHLLTLWDELEELLDRKVDLLTDQPILNPYLKESIEKTKLLIYDGENQEVFI